MPKKASKPPNPLRALRADRTDPTARCAAVIPPQSEDQYCTLFEAAMDGIVLHEPVGEKAPGKFLEANRAVCRLLGYTRPEMQNLTLPDILAPEDLVHAGTDAERLRRDGLLLHTKTLRAKDGRRIPVEISSHQFNLQGKPMVMSIIRDITERQQATKALRESEERLQEALRVSRSFAFEWEPASDRVRRSASCGPVLGLSGDAMSEDTGQGFFQRVHPEDRDRFVATLEALKPGAETYEIRYRVKRPDGGITVLEESGRGYFDSAGRLCRLVGVSTDVTLREEAEAALRHSERLYRAIGESIDYGIWICDPAGRNTYASESFLKLVGLTQEQCSNFGWGSVLHPDDAERTIAAWKECVRTSGTWDIEHRFRGVDGRWHPILARGVPVRDEQGRVMCWAGINLDISQLKQAEERLRASLQEKEVLLREIHHRVKNNLQIISSLVSLQSEAQNNPALRVPLADVRDRIRTMALVHERLYQSTSLAQVDFADYAASLLQFLWRAHGTFAAKVRLNLALQRVTLPVDTAVHCGLILNELASNALKHAFRNLSGGQVTVGLQQEADTGRIRLWVSDDGAGLPPNLDWRQSTSLGLRLVRMLAAQMQGTLEAGPGPGTEFRLTFSPIESPPNNLPSSE